MNKTLLLFLFFISFTVPCFQTGAEEISTLSFSVAAPSSKPFAYIGEQGDTEGFFVELFALVQKKAGIKITVTVMPWVRGMREVKLGHYDALIPTLYTKEREKHIVYPDKPVIDFHTVLLKRKDDGIVISSIAELDPQRAIAKKRGMSMGSVFDNAERKGKINVIEVRDHEHAIKMLALSRVDLVACVEYVCDTSLINLNLHNKVDVIKTSDSRFPSYLAFSKKFAETHDINKIMKEINKVKTTSEYQGLVTKFLN